MPTPTPPPGASCVDPDLDVVRFRQVRYKVRQGRTRCRLAGAEGVADKAGQVQTAWRHQVRVGRWRDSIGARP